MQIDIINRSTVIGDADLGKIISALQTQVKRDFAPIWHEEAEIALMPKGQDPRHDRSWIAVLDNSDVAEALGYHETTSAGLPMGKVFAAEDLKYGNAISVTLSHELLEMLADPHINQTAMMGDGRIYAYENCDAVEADSLGYMIEGIRVSDFVTPAYFEPPRHGARYDFGGHLAGPCPALMPGGYISVYDPVSRAWVQIISRKTRRDLILGHPPIGSRRWRRQVPLEERLRSVPKKENEK